jgi:hypothetical protein
MTKVPVAVATTLSFCQSSALPWHISRPRNTTRPSPFKEPSTAGRWNCALRLTVGANCPESSVAESAVPHSVVEHSREKATLHVSCRIEESLDRLKSGLNGAAFSVDFNEAKTERLRARRRWHLALDYLPEKRIPVQDVAFCS